MQHVVVTAARGQNEPGSCLVGIQFTIEPTEAYGVSAPIALSVEPSAQWDMVASACEKGGEFAVDGPDRKVSIFVCGGVVRFEGPGCSLRIESARCVAAFRTAYDLTCATFRWIARDMLLQMVGVLVPAYREKLVQSVAEIDTDNTTGATSMLQSGEYSSYAMASIITSACASLPGQKLSGLIETCRGLHRDSYAERKAMAAVAMPTLTALRGGAW